MLAREVGNLTFKLKNGAYYNSYISVHLNNPPTWCLLHVNVIKIVSGKKCVWSILSIAMMQFIFHSGKQVFTLGANDGLISSPSSMMIGWTYCNTPGNTKALLSCSTRCLHNVHPCDVAHESQTCHMCLH